MSIVFFCRALFGRLLAFRRWLGLCVSGLLIEGFDLSRRER